ncbi:MAG: hypothetical protein QOJ23_1341 [Actinomycetota bacterium]|jgi:hypothetical protein|nr:hypothetical protein [Actinomycetota bacterium]MDQ1499887.1 hypothetical protein [Actinomycetota bacterium]
MQANRHPNEGRGIDIALGGLAPIAVAAALVAVRGHVASANVALVLGIIVVVAGAVGGRAAGMVAALTAAASYDFFHTRPYLSLLIHDVDDVEMTLLLLVLGLVSGQLAWQTRVAARQRDGGRGGLDQIRRLADRVAHGNESADVIAAARDELSTLFDLVDCRFEAAPFQDRLDLPCLERNGVVARRRYRMQPGRELELELPVEGIALPVLSRGQIVGRFLLDFGPGAGATLEQRVVAIALADQVGASLAVYPPPLSIR